MRTRRFLLAGIVCALCLIFSPAQAQSTVTDDLLTAFEQILRDEMITFNVPGVAVAIIEDDEVIYAEGFGSRDLATGAPFTTETQFRIGSTTKSMTSLLIAQLVDEGLLSWDTPVTDIFPDFATVDPELTAQITVADVMGMDTGLVTGTLSGLTWDDWDINTLLDSIANMAIEGDFRDYYSYNNEVYALAGYVATSAVGLSPTLDNYRTLMQERIFTPIGMESAIITDDISQLSDNYAESYETSVVTADLTQMINAPIAFISPAGAVWTNIEDMARYVMTQMNGGVTPDGERIVSEEALSETWRAGVSIPGESPVIEDATYGMGWVTEMYQGVAVRYHDGSWAGYNTQMFILPGDDVAIINFSNSTNGALYGAMLNYAFIELLHDLEPNAIQTAHEFNDDLNAQMAQAQGLISLDIGDLSDLTGTYAEGWTVEWRGDDGAWITGHGWEFQIGYIAMLDQYVLINNGAAGVFVNFETEGDTVELVLSIDGEELSRLPRNE